MAFHFLYSQGQSLYDGLQCNVVFPRLTSAVLTITSNFALYNLGFLCPQSLHLLPVNYLFILTLTPGTPDLCRLDSTVILKCHYITESFSEYFIEKESTFPQSLPKVLTLLYFSSSHVTSLPSTS